MYTLLKKGLMFMVLLLPALVQAQVAEQYAEAALRSNLTLKQQNFQLERSLQQLREANSYFLPNISLQGTYVKSEGGRYIDLPIGDLLNPVYNSLNQMTHSDGFPQIENQTIGFNPNNYYDAKLHTTLPLINAEIWYNRQIKKEMLNAQQAALNVYKRELVRNVKKAYYQCVQADKAVAIYEQAMTLVDENIRVNESLYRNGVRNNTSLTRAQAEKKKVEAAYNDAQNQKRNAIAYLNFLLDRPLDASVDIDSSATLQLQASTTHQREELLQLGHARQAYDINAQMQRSYLIPKLNTFLDLGSQSDQGKFDNKSRYYFWGLSLQWDLFAGGQHSAKARQAEAEHRQVITQYDETENALKLQLQQAENNYNTALENYRHSVTQEQLASKYYTDQFKVYKEGQLLYVELLDAQNELTQSKLKASIAMAAVRSAAADLERANASYPIH